VLLPADVWRELAALRADAPDYDAPVFCSKRSARPLDDRQARRLVEAAAARAGHPGTVEARAGSS
jgi:hypothetical protein